MVLLCEFSSTIFGGFQCTINVKGIESIDEVVVLAISQLRDIMEKNRLSELVKKVDEIKWHIHSHTLEDILTSKNDIIWICDHCS